MVCSSIEDLVVLLWILVYGGNVFCVLCDLGCYYYFVICVLYVCCVEVCL